MILTEKFDVTVYASRLIKKLFDTQISELSVDGNYDLYPYVEFKITQPIGGEKFVIGKFSDRTANGALVLGNNYIDIMWSVELPLELKGALMKIAYNTDMQPYTTIASVGSTDLGTYSYRWVLDSAKFKDADTYKIKIYSEYLITGQDANGNPLFKPMVVSDEMKDPFEVLFKQIVVSPIDKNQSFEIGSNQTISIPFTVYNIGDYVKVNQIILPGDTSIVVLEPTYRIQGSTNTYKLSISDLQGVHPGDRIAIRISDPADASIFGDSYFITMKAPIIPPGPPAIPADLATTIGITDAVLAWKKVTDASSYLAEVATDENFIDVVWSGPQSTVSINNALQVAAIPANTLNMGTKYWWRVRAVKSGAAPSAWTESMFFTTSMGGTASSSTNKLVWHIYPNDPQRVHVTLDKWNGRQNIEYNWGDDNRQVIGGNVPTSAEALKTGKWHASHAYIVPNGETKKFTITMRWEVPGSKSIDNFDIPDTTPTEVTVIGSGYMQASAAVIDEDMFLTWVEVMQYRESMDHWDPSIGAVGEGKFELWYNANTRPVLWHKSLATGKWLLGEAPGTVQLEWVKSSHDFMFTDARPREYWLQRYKDWILNGWIMGINPAHDILGGGIGDGSSPMS